MTTLPALPFSNEHPYRFLAELFEIDEIAAVRVANRWADIASATPTQYSAAWALVNRQTAFPVCISCRWPVVDDDPHPKCEAELRNKVAASSVDDDDPRDDDGDEGDDYPYGDDPLDDEDDICDGICGQPADLCTCAETEAYRQHNTNPDTRGSWFVA